MKKIILLFFLLAIISSKAEAFQMPTYVRFSPLVATAEVYNNLFRPIMCNGQAEAQTVYGQVLFSYMDRVVIMPGTTAYFHVYTNALNPLNVARAFSNCWFY